jgi:hypothetical protein
MFWAPSRSDETPNQVEEPPSHPLFMSAYRSEAKTSSLLWPRTRTVLERLAAEYNAPQSPFPSIIGFSKPIRRWATKFLSCRRSG